MRCRISHIGKLIKEVLGYPLYTVISFEVWRVEKVHFHIRFSWLDSADNLLVIKKIIRNLFSYGNVSKPIMEVALLVKAEFLRTWDEDEWCARNGIKNEYGLNSVCQAFKDLSMNPEEK